MKHNTKRLLGGIAATGILASGLALSAVAPASAAETEAAPAAVQGDRLEGPWIARTTVDPSTGSTAFWRFNMLYTSTSTSGTPTLSYVNKQAPIGGPVPTEFSQPIEIWTFPAVGTTGPIINSAGLCLQPLNSSLRLVDCDDSPEQQFTIDELGRMYPTSMPNRGITENFLSLRPNPNNDGLYLDGLTPVVTEPEDCTAGLAASISGVDHEAGSAVVSGTGAAGETITVAGSPTGDVTATVAADGTWTATVGGLATGDNALTVTSSDNCAPVELSVIIEELEIPLAHPAALAGVGVLGLGALLVGGIRRRAAARV